MEGASKQVDSFDSLEDWEWKMLEMSEIFLLVSFNLSAKL